ncbi:putative Zn finger-like uncharacterized protein [Azospirillum fermentarium]|uniref:zinc-ribbon domain-containing protein n=1 Tax=Azospirillum fermentarium TaxID=1233114 RepID=UPI002227E40E|nr:zinc-ribbon domain-containing protein [Azospirillum fermentarium]MCW2246409.1 putative Zn finger-like uncharacterized protein [Azospirillum fermentarium]
MILTCPKCSKRYTVSDAAVGTAGRKVRCAGCGHVWFQTPEAPPAPEPPPLFHDDDDEPFGRRPVIPSDMEDEPDFAPPPRLKKPAKPRRPRRPMSKGAMAAWAALVLAVAGIGAGAVLARDAVVTAWPKMAVLYDTVGLPLEPPGAGLELQNVRSQQHMENGALVLVVEGQVVNASTEQRKVPKLRAVSLNAEQHPVKAWSLDASAVTLLPGEIATFQSTQHNPGAVAQVLVTFAGGGGPLADVPEDRPAAEKPHAPEPAKHEPKHETKPAPAAASGGHAPAKH